MITGDITNNGLFYTLIAVVVTLGVPAIIKVFNKRRGLNRAGRIKVEDRCTDLEKDRDLVFDWLLGPKGFDGKRHGGFMESDKSFKTQVMAEISGKK